MQLKKKNITYNVGTEGSRRGVE